MKQRYKEMKPPMGAYAIRNKVNGKIFINVTNDIKSMFNRIKFQLKLGSYPVKELQNDWKEYGEEAFIFEILEELKYDEKDDKKDYNDELEILRMIWQENYKQRKIVFYVK